MQQLAQNKVTVDGHTRANSIPSEQSDTWRPKRSPASRHDTERSMLDDKRAMAHLASALAGVLLWLSVSDTRVSAFQRPRLLALGIHAQGTSSNPVPISPSPAANLDTAKHIREIHYRNRGRLQAEATAGGDATAPEPIIVPSSSTAMVKVEGTDDDEKVFRRLWKSVLRFFGGGKDKPDLKQLGLYALLSYGFVSNASYCACTGIAWFISSRKSGLSPLAPDQWQLFLACWAGLWAVNNVLRVPRLGVAVALAPTFDRFISFLMTKTGRGKAFATALCVFLVNVLGTLSLMATCIVLASILSGVPFWPVAAA